MRAREAPGHADLADAIHRIRERALRQITAMVTHDAIERMIGCEAPAVAAPDGEEG